MTARDGAVFIVDASTWIKLYEEHYPPDVFPSLWTALQQAAKDNRIKAPVEVMREVRESSGVGAWLRTLKPTIVPPRTATVQRMVGEIVAEFPSFTHGVHESADPWIVAFAKANGWTVVSEEGLGSKAKPMIPYVCMSRDVTQTRCLQMLRALGVKLCPSHV